MARLLHAGVAAGVVALSSLACSSGGQSPVSTEAGQSAAEPPALTAYTTPDMLALPYELSIDPATLEGTVIAQPERAATAQGFVFDLDIANFMRPSNLRVVAVSRQLGGDLTVRIRHSHPFPAVNPNNPAVGTNRADLGYTGRLMVLTDGTAQSFFSGAVSVDPGFLKNADGYAEVGNLLAVGGQTNNAFPYKLLVDEELNNRVGVTNGGTMTGSYNPVIGGWQRSNLGTSNTGWTGYDYLHGGQSTDIDLQIASSRLTGSISVPLAVLIKYVDPKGVGSGSKRIPPSTPDVTFFAYRLPHSAMDVSKIDGVNTPLINDTAGSMATLQFEVRDWDSQAASAADTDLSDETNVSFILPGTSGPPTVELSVPAFAGAAIPIFPSGGASGQPGDEIPYLVNVTNSNGTAPAGNVYGLIRVVDKEDNIPAATSIHFGVDPVSLAADAARALRVRTYQTVRFIVQGTGVPPEILSVTPSSGNIGRVGDLVSYSAIASNSPTGWNWDFGGGTSPNTSPLGTPLVMLAARGSFTGSVDATNAFGTSPSFPFTYSVSPFGWAHTFGGASTDTLTGIDVDSSGNVFVAGTFAGAVNFSKTGPSVINTSTGTSDAFVAKYDPDGTLLWARTFGGNADVSVTKLAVDTLDRVYIIGTADADFDSDPGAGTTNLNFTSAGAYAILLDDTGAFVRSFGWNGIGVTGSLTITGEVDAANNFLVGGQFINALGFDVDPTFGTDNKLTLGLVYSYGWVAKLSSAGTYLWGQHWGNNFGHTRLRGVVADSTNNLRIVGSWADTTDFDPGAGTANRTAVAPFDDAYFLTLTGAGTYVDVQTWGNNNEDQAQAISSGNLDTVAIGGWTRGASAVDVDPGVATVNVTMPDTTNGGAYVVRYNVAAATPAFGGIVPAAFNGTTNIRLAGNPANPKDTLVSVRVASSMDADPGAGLVPVSGTDDPLFVLLDSSNAYQGSYFFNEGGSGLPLGALTNSSEAFLAGYFQGGPIDFDPNPGFADNHTSAGSNDCFLVRCNDTLEWD